MDDLSYIGRRLIRLADSIVNIFVLVAILLMMAFGFYAVWDSSQVSAEASPGRYAAYRPDAVNTGKSFQELQAINKDVFAWLNIYGTEIDYPVVQGKDNLRYISTDAEGKHSLPGAIFLDYRNNSDFSDFNSIVYGHHMAQRRMFGDLSLFNDAEFFNTHRYGSLYFNGVEHGIEFFVFFHCDGYDTKVFNPNITDQANQQLFLDMLLDRAEHRRQSVTVTVEDNIVMLTTCSVIETNSRSILIGKITDEVAENPFAAEQANTNVIPMIDALQSYWADSPFAMKVILVGTPLFVIGLFVYSSYRKRRRYYLEEK